ncbi:reverse transcriptase [Senna tora]|uniref:Reverse transcriptase n=1 Tax=Senna tora TaxID=362788 RepID=A0A835C895_9FABA|nr:reverse transcriptase [Senna tora]
MVTLLAPLAVSSLTTYVACVPNPQSLAVEKILESLRISCPNAKYGCKEYVGYVESESDHQNACLFAPFSCLHLGCDFVGLYEDLSLHLTTKHKDSTLRFVYDNDKGVSVSLDSKAENDFVVLREGNSGDLFVVSSKVVENAWHLVNVRLVGLKSSREERFYSVCAKSFDDQRTVSFTGSAKSVDPASTDCVLIPSSFFKTCAQIEVEDLRTTGPQMDFPYLQTRLLKLWKLKGTPKIWQLGMGFYIIAELLPEDRLKLLTSTPWFLGKSPILVRQWFPHFSPILFANDYQTAIWVKLPFLPIEYHDPDFLLAIGKSIGNVVALDLSTRNSLIVNHARICIEINLLLPLPPFCIINGYKQSIIFERIESYPVSFHDRIHLGGKNFQKFLDNHTDKNPAPKEKNYPTESQLNNPDKTLTNHVEPLALVAPAIDHSTPNHVQNSKDLKENKAGQKSQTHLKAQNPNAGPTQHSTQSYEPTPIRQSMGLSNQSGTHRTKNKPLETQLHMQKIKETIQVSSKPDLELRKQENTIKNTQPPLDALNPEQAKVSPLNNSCSSPNEAIKEQNLLTALADMQKIDSHSDSNIHATYGENAKINSNITEPHSDSSATDQSLLTSIKPQLETCNAQELLLTITNLPIMYTTQAFKELELQSQDASLSQLKIIHPEKNGYLHDALTATNSPANRLQLVSPSPETSPPSGKNAENTANHRNVDPSKGGDNPQLTRKPRQVHLASGTTTFGRGETSSRISNPMQPPFDLFLVNEDLSFLLKMNILAWNVRGAGGADFRRVFRETVAIHQPDAVILTETRVSGERANGIINSLGFEHTYKVDTMGFAGGIWVLWNDNNISIRIVGSSFQEVHCIFKETMHSMNASKSKIGWMIIKLDISKAFDTLSWNFINQILGPLRKSFIGPLPNESQILKLSDLLHSWPPAETINLPQNTKNEILSTFIHLNNNNQDIIAWKNSKDRNFSIKSAYIESINKYHHENENLLWMWKPIAHPRELLFLWKAYHNALPTASKLYRLSCLQSLLCNLCLLDEENPIHILRDCQVSSNIWSSLKVPSSFYQDPIQSWLKLNAKDSSPSSFNIPWKTIFTYTVRGIWLARNEKFFKGKAFNPAVLVNQILQKAVEFSHLSSHCRPPPTTHTIQVSWTKPHPHYNPGGIIRDDKGNHVISFSHFTGSGNIFIAELWALQIGIQLVVKQRVNYLEIESDSISVVQLTKDQNLPNISPFFSVVNNCRYLLSSLQQWKIRHCYREANTCADALANHGRLSRKQHAIFHNPPIFLIKHLQHDHHSCQLPRNVPCCSSTS